MRLVYHWHWFSFRITVLKFYLIWNSDFFFSNDRCESLSIRGLVLVTLLCMKSIENQPLAKKIGRVGILLRTFEGIFPRIKDSKLIAFPLRNWQVVHNDTHFPTLHSAYVYTFWSTKKWPVIPWPHVYVWPIRKLSIKSKPCFFKSFPSYWSDKALYFDGYRSNQAVNID